MIQLCECNRVIQIVGVRGDDCYNISLTHIQQVKQLGGVHREPVHACWFELAEGKEDAALSLSVIVIIGEQGLMCVHWGLITAHSFV